MEYRPPLYLGVVAIEKGAFGSLLTMVTNFTFYLFTLTGLSTFLCVKYIRVSSSQTNKSLEEPKSCLTTHF